MCQGRKIVELKKKKKVQLLGFFVLVVKTLGFIFNLFSKITDLKFKKTKTQIFIVAELKQLMFKNKIPVFL